MRRARTLITPWWRSSRPRTRSAGDVRATLRNRFHTSGGADHVHEPGLVLEVEEHHALRGLGLLAVRDHARRPPRPCGRAARAASSAVTTPRAVSSLAHELGGVPAGRQPGRPQVGRGLLDLVHPRQRRRLDAGDDARAACRAARRAARRRPTARSRRSTPKHANAPAVASASSASTGALGAAGEVLEVGERLHRRARRRCGRAARRTSPRTYRSPMRTAWIDGSACQPGLRVPDRSGRRGARLERAVAARRVRRTGRAPPRRDGRRRARCVCGE